MVQPFANLLALGGSEIAEFVSANANEKPPGMAAGDLLIVAVNNLGPAPAPAEGFDFGTGGGVGSPHDSISWNTTNAHLSLFKVVLTPAIIAGTWSSELGSTWMAAVYRGAVLAPRIATSNTFTGVTGLITQPSYVPTGAQRGTVSIAVVVSNGATPPAGFTKRESEGGIALADRLGPNGHDGSEGTWTSAGIDPRMVIVLELR